MKREMKRKSSFLTVGVLSLGIASLYATPDQVETAAASNGGDDIPDDTLRVHYDQGNDDVSDIGLWLWEDVETPSEDEGDWPDGKSFTEDQKTDYGPYLDIALQDDAELVNLHVYSEEEEDAITDDVDIEILSEDMNEVWLSEEGDLYHYEPVELEDNKIRVHYYSEDENYEPWGLWTWEDVAEPTEEWPMGAHPFTSDNVGPYGSYVDLEVTEDAEEVGLLLVERNENPDESDDMFFRDFENHDQVFLKEGENEAYTNPYYVQGHQIEYGQVKEEDRIELGFTATEGMTTEQLGEELDIVDANGNEVSFDEAVVEDEQTVSVYGQFDHEVAPFDVSYGDQSTSAFISWQLKDELYAYDGDLGVDLHDDGSATLKLWSPSADNISIILYDRDDQYEVVVDDVDMIRQDTGVWEVTLDEENTGVEDLTGYYYHYEIERDGETVKALDPYASSMATWDSSREDDGEFHVGKAAIVDPSSIGPELDYADIEGFEKREDAIIYETHVRDFTVDPTIDEELESQFGTFASFVEKLDYMEDMGVTHIQLLPVMSYFFADEYNNDERLMDYSSTQNNYNWGYDPHSYFSLTGMYSEDPDDAEKRIEEFKKLIDEIHDRGMGVILDVVYNHTAREHLFEDLEPNYYHFMDADGTSRISFGGGRLGTTHEMARRILVDSVMYWVEEFKVDGFRFDMMGDQDAETIQKAYDKAKEANPNIVMIGEGWRTYVGDETDPDVQPADQDWMQDTESVGSFSDDFRNELKSGFGFEGEPQFITGGERDIQQIYDNVTANPHNFKATNPGDVVPYVAAHDNLTLHDVIAYSIEKDPDYHQEEIHERIRLGNLMTLTAQGTPFIHSGQEYGRTKQFRHDDYQEEVDEPPYASTFMTDEDGEPFKYPYFIHDSYDSTDAVNLFDWEKATNEEAYPINVETRDFTRGMIELRRSTDAFRHGTMEDIDENVSFIDAPEIDEEDLIIGYKATSSDQSESYYVFVNADDQERTLTLEDADLTEGTVIVDSNEAGVTEVEDPTGFELTQDDITLDALSAVVVQKDEESAQPEGAFEDVDSGFWAANYIERLATNDIVKGYADNVYFKPSEQMSRSQFAVVLTRSLDLSTSETYNNQFPDVEGSEWFVEELMPAYEVGIIQGRDSGELAPNENVTREEAAVMVARAMEHIGHEPKLDEDNHVTDLEDTANFAKNDVEQIVQAGIMQGNSDNELNPKDPTTRAQMAAIVDRFLQEANVLD
ncbi:pullulanase [Texcoconibacillus texcoconensis]|uniref:pullulanase n=1 Tax=Texcoconibacillus texcoconensis TaxID=1095777 RepID=A0A840QM86_9BACI|nr:secreted pullulanase [Texcoconibacillus texcoconensis]